jgi:GT2 family glycosyltransferase
MMQSSDLAGFVINYYRRPSFPPSHRTATTLSIQALKENIGVGHVILVDGSNQPDLYMQDVCNREGIDYLHTGKELTFAQGYNIGWKLLGEPYVGFMANDTFPSKGTISNLLEYIKLLDVGCVFPYISYCDYPGQIYTFARRPITCEPTIMTLNLNIFKREVLEKVMGVDDGYSGCYNDIILLMKIRSTGYRVVLVGNTRVFHMGQMTLSQGSTYAQEKDIRKFKEQYSSYMAEHGIFGVSHWKWPLATTRIVALLWWLSQNNMSATLRNLIQNFVMKLEPELTSFPAEFGKSNYP